MEAIERRNPLHSARHEAAMAEAVLALRTAAALSEALNLLVTQVGYPTAGRHLLVAGALEVGLRATLGRLADLIPKGGE